MTETSRTFTPDWVSSPGDALTSISGILFNQIEVITQR